MLSEIEYAMRKGIVNIYRTVQDNLMPFALFYIVVLLKNSTVLNNYVKIYFNYYGLNYINISYINCYR